VQNITYKTTKKDAVMSNGFKEERERLRDELTELKEQNRKLAQKLERANGKVADLKRELKKNDGSRVALTKEQEQLLLNLLKGTGTLSSSLD